MVDLNEVRKEVEAGKFHPVYLLLGSGALRKEKWLDLLAEKFLGTKRSQADGYQRVDGRAQSLPHIINEMLTPTLFSAGKQLVVIDDPSFLLAPRGGKKKKAAAEEDGAEEEEGAKAASSEEKKQAEAFEAFWKTESAKAEPENIIVFLVEKVDKRKKFYRQQKEKMSITDCSPLKGKTLRKWVSDNVKKYGKTIPAPALEKFIWLTDGDMWRLEKEIAKICTYLQDDEEVVTEEVVEKLVYGGPQGDIFKLVDALGEGNFARAYRYLWDLFALRTEPVFILYMITRQFRLILQALDLKKQGYSASQAPSKLGVQPFVAQKIYGQAGRYTRGELRGIYQLLQETDLNIKKGNMEGQVALEVLLGRISALKQER